LTGSVQGGPIPDRPPPGRPVRGTSGTEVMSMSPTLPDQQTTHESVPDTGHVGRFSTGLETTPLTPDKLHRGKYSEGLDQVPDAPQTRHPGRFSEGLDRTPETLSKSRHGSFSDAQH